MSEIKRVILSDGRVFSGAVVVDTPDHVDLVWTDRGVNHQVSVPKNQVVETGEAGPMEIRPDGDGKLVCKVCKGKQYITEMALGHCLPCWEKKGGELPSHSG